MEFYAGTQTGYIWLGNQNATSWAGAGGLNIYTSAGNMDLWTAGVQRMRVTSGGNVGIGTLSPGTLLDVNGIGSFRGANNTTDNIRLYNTDGNYTYLRTTAASNNNNFWIDPTLGATIWLGWDNPGQARTANTYSQVYIGTGRGTLNESVLLRRGDIEGKDGAGTVNYRIVTTGALGSHTYFNYGNVGIGTTSPIGKLQIGGTSGNLLTVGTLTNNWGGDVAIGITNGNGVILSKVNTANDSNRVLVLSRDDTNGASITGYTPTGGSTDVGFLIRANATSYFNGGMLV